VRLRPIWRGQLEELGDGGGGVDGTRDVAELVGDRLLAVHCRRGEDPIGAGVAVDGEFTEGHRRLGDCRWQRVVTRATAGAYDDEAKCRKEQTGPHTNHTSVVSRY
jgi:hypothetical protein